MKSVWENYREIPSFPKLEGDKKTDVLIIGGGLCGVLCAYFLEQEGVDYLLAEADRIGRGVTGCTTAKITSQHGLIYEKLLRKYGREKALQYLHANEWALEKYRELAQKTECDFEEKDAFVYTLASRGKIEREVQAVNDLGFPAEFVQNLQLPFQTEGAIRFPNQAQFHPRKFLTQIAQGLKIYEHTYINELAPLTARYDGGTITAEKMIVATHFPFLNRYGGYFLKLYQHRSYVMALQNAQDVGGMYVDEEQGGLSFRNYQDLLLVGGGSHRTGRTGGGWQELQEFAAQYYSGTPAAAYWATQDCMSLDAIPYIGVYSRHTPGLYVASGFEKWGMTTSMAAAHIITEMICGRETGWEAVFDPARSIWESQLLFNALEALGSLLAPTGKRCPHMGCALKWNSQEHTWDCSCHGSRFEADGRLINNPAMGNVKTIFTKNSKL